MTGNDLPDDVRFENGVYVVSDPTGDYKYESKQDAVQHAKLMDEMSGKPGDLMRIKYAVGGGEVRREDGWMVVETEKFVVARRVDDTGTYELVRKAGEQPLKVGEFGDHKEVISKIRQRVDES